MHHVELACAIESEVSYRCHRFPHDTIALAVWLYYRFPLSLRMVEEILASRSADQARPAVVPYVLLQLLDMP